MLAIILLASGPLMLAFAFGLLDFSFDDVAEEIESADLDGKIPLLDDAEIQRMEDAFVNDPLLQGGALISDYLNEDQQLEIYADTDWSSNEGTDGNDFMAFPEGLEESDPLFGGEGNDVLLGSDEAERYEVMFGEEGDDTLFGRAGEDWLFGDDGNDILSGGDQGDLLVGGEGSDLIYGGAGNDNIYDDGLSAATDLEDTDVINAGAGDDGVVISDGINLVALGEGRDHLTILAENDDNPGAVVTDFDPAEDALLIGVYSEELNLPSGVNAIELPFTLTAVETDLGPATFVQPASQDGSLTGSLSDLNGGYAVLLGVTPEELEGALIRVVLESDETNNFNGELSVMQAARDMGATRL